MPVKHVFGHFCDFFHGQIFCFTPIISHFYGFFHGHFFTGTFFHFFTGLKFGFVGINLSFSRVDFFSFYQSQFNYGRLSKMPPPNGDFAKTFFVSPPSCFCRNWKFKFLKKPKIIYKPLEHFWSRFWNFNIFSINGAEIAFFQQDFLLSLLVFRHVKTPFETIIILPVFRIDNRP